MTVENMHYDFKMKVNKLDSSANRNFLPQEVDWLLNEAQMVFIKNSGMPRILGRSGVEFSQRLTDDLRTLVVRGKEISIVDELCALPQDYLSFISAEVDSSASCGAVRSRLIIRQQDDRFEDDPFSKSSIAWREVNGVFTDKGIKTFPDGDNANTTLHLTYLRKPSYIHWADGVGGEYELPDGTLLQGKQDCELPEHTHTDVVDLAVLLATQAIASPNIQISHNKLQMNQIV